MVLSIYCVWFSCARWAQENQTRKVGGLAQRRRQHLFGKNVLAGACGGDHDITVLDGRCNNHHRVDIIARQHGRQALLELAAPLLCRRAATLGQIIPDSDDLGIGVLGGLLGVIFGVNVPETQHC
jgi:hypothetical protein